jgi:hypothetical protein
VRIGFLIRDGHIEDLEKAAAINTLLWGGVHNPIIPVAAGREVFAKQFLHLFAVDTLYPVTQSPEIDALQKEYWFLQSRKMHTRNIFFQDWRSKKNKLGYLDSLNIVDKYWEREFKHKRADFKSNCTLATWRDDDPLKSVFALQFGSFPQEFDLEDDFPHGFGTGLRAKELALGPEDRLKPEFATSIFPLQLTGMDLQGYGGGFSLDRSGIYIGDQADFRDLLVFWNLRAAGYAITFVPMDHLDRMREFAAAHVKWVDELPHAHPNIEDYIAFHYPPEHEGQCTEIIESFPTQKQRLISPYSDVIWNGLNVIPRRYYFSFDTSVASVETPHDRVCVVLPLPEKKFLPESDRDIREQQLAVSVQVFTEFEYPGYTLRPPYLRELNEYYSREIAFDPWSLRVEPEGVAFVIDTHDAVERLYPIPHNDVLTKVFETAGIRAQPSQAGLLATRIIEQLGDIERGRVFKITGVRKLIQDVGPEKPVTRSTAVQMIWDDGRFKKHEGLYIEPRKHKKLCPQDAFDYLLKKDFFRAGLELTCARCKLLNWLSLRDIDDLWTCQYCGNEDRVSLHVRHRGDWKFRKSGLLAKDNNQEGAIPVILSLLAFARVVHVPMVMHATALSLSSEGRSCEVDYVVFHYGEFAGEDRLRIAIGEAKGGGGEINEQDIQNMRFIREQLEKQHIACYLAFSKTTDAFTVTELERFRKLRDDEVPVILLTNRELEPYEPYLEDEDGSLPERYAHSFADMARNSEARYLPIAQEEANEAK